MLMVLKAFKNNVFWYFLHWIICQKFRKNYFEMKSEKFCDRCQNLFERNFFRNGFAIWKFKFREKEEIFRGRRLFRCIFYLWEVSNLLKADKIHNTSDSEALSNFNLKFDSYYQKFKCNSWHVFNLLLQLNPIS